MQLSLVGMVTAALIAMPAIAAQNPSAGSSQVDTHASQPASTASTTVRPAAASAQPGTVPVQHYVDLNSASRQELMTLPGIGADEAKRIIANRPYLTKTELVTKNVLPLGPFLSLRHRVVAMPAKASKGRS